MARRKQAAAEAIQPTTTVEAAPPPEATATPTVVTEGGQPADERQPTRFPDPREQKSVSLGADRDSPRLRLLRSHRFNQMQIRCDEELPEAYREQLKAAGWTERPGRNPVSVQLSGQE